MSRNLLLLALSLATLTASAGEVKDYTPAFPAIKVNGETVPPEALKKRYEFWLKVYKAPGKPLSNDFLDQLAKISREQIVQQIAIRQHVEKEKLTLTPESLKEDLDAFKADLAAQGKKFEDVLKSRDKTEDEFMAEFAQRAAIARETRAAAEKDMAELKGTFDKEKEKMGLRRASQIRFSYEKTLYTAHPQRTKEDAKKEAGHALERARKGEDFTTLAKQLSDDTVSREQGGDLGWLSHNYIPKTVATALYALEKTGDITELVESEQGFHILRMTDQKTDDDQFKAFLKQRMYMRTLAAENKLAKDAKVEIEKAADATTK